MILTALLESESSDRLCLVGMIFADGLLPSGDVQLFDAWCKRFSRVVLELPQPPHVGATLSAWAASQQTERRKKLMGQVSSDASPLNIGRWLSVSESVAELGDLGPSSNVFASILRGSAKNPTDQGWVFGVQRILSVVSGCWPDVGDVSLLQLWPSFRRIAGVRCQIAVACGASRADLVQLAAHYLHPPPFVGQNLAVLPTLLQVADRNGLKARSGLRCVGPGIACMLERVGFSIVTLTFGDRAAQFALNGRFNSARIYQLDGIVRARQLTLRDLSGFAPLARASESASAAEVNLAQWEKDARLLLACSASMYGSRFDVRFKARGGRGASRLLQAAARLSVDPENAAAVKRFVALDRRTSGGLDGLWTSLARYIARRPMAHDVDVLVGAATEPERFAVPLRFGLQYLVRGDIAMGDGTVLTLDEIAAEAGLPSVPLVEPMPDEVDIAAYLPR